MAMERQVLELKTCTKCGESKDLSEFPADRRNADGRMGTCKVCECERNKSWQAANQDKVLAFRRARYGIDFNSLWEKQGGLCALCGEVMLPRGKSARSVVIDHDHNCCPPKPGRAGSSCGFCVRGLLHRHCNMLVGLVEKNRDRLSQVDGYLRRWRESLT